MGKRIAMIVFGWIAAWAHAGPPPHEMPRSTASINHHGLVVEFRDSMHTWSDSVGKSFVSLEPELPLACRWDSDTRLACSFEAEKASPATRYRIHLAPGLVTANGNVLPGQTLEAETKRPELYAWIVDWKDGQPSIVVRSNLRTVPVDVARALKLEIDGTEHPADIRIDESAERWAGGAAYSLLLPPIARRDALLVLSGRPGLRSEEGPLPGVQTEVLVNAITNEPFRLRATRCGHRAPVARAVDETGPVRIACEADDVIGLIFSQTPDADSMKEWVATWPESVRKIDARHPLYHSHFPGSPARSPNHEISLAIHKPRHTRHLQIPSTLQGERDALNHTVDLRLVIGDRYSRVTSLYQDSLLVRGGTPSARVHAVNAPPTRFSIHAQGMESRREYVEGPRRRSNLSQSIRSIVADETLAEGGWVHWNQEETSPAHQSKPRFPSVAQFSAPDFDLLAVGGRQQVLAWTNNWDEGVSRDGIEVGLLRIDHPDAQALLIATATTSADGTALLTIPDGSVSSSKQGAGHRDTRWLLRARRNTEAGTDLGVLPLDALTSTLESRPSTHLWGVTDRPIYRAGDTLRYRLWSRQGSGARLRRIPTPESITLVLHQTIEDKDILEWSAAPDPMGAVHGELILPSHLPDDEYCIGSHIGYSVEGICFFVGTFRAQDLWAEATASDEVLREGDVFTVDVSAGYYSGGAASGVIVQSAFAMITGLPIEQAYPQHSEFRFIDVMTEDAISGVSVGSREMREPRLLTDRDGKASIPTVIEFGSRPRDPEFEPPHFGLIQIVAEVMLGEREGTMTPAATSRYTRHERFVGLRIHPQWPDAGAPVTFEGIVIDANGERIDDAPIEVDVHFRSKPEASEDESPTPLVRCTLGAHARADCDFPRERNGWYVATARSGDAAPTEIVRYISARTHESTLEIDSASLEQLEIPLVAGAPARIMLQQPYAQARVLFAFVQGNTILASRTESVASTAQVFTLATPDFVPGRKMLLHAIVRDATQSPSMPAPYRSPPRILQTSVDLQLANANASAAPLVAEFDRTDARPGDRVSLRLHNTSATVREVVVAVMDDALRALGAQWLQYSDPLGDSWLGGLDLFDSSYLAISSFANWNQGDWELLPTPPRDQGTATRGNRRTVVAEVAPVRAGVSSSDKLETVVVTGSRISAVDVFQQGPQPVRGLRRRENTSSAHVIDRVRTQFADTALWIPDLRLKPGEVRNVEVKLPDNLTRWRAVVWSSDADDGFHMTDSSVDAGLPIEVRLQVPTRIHEGDRSVLAANFRNATADALRLATTLTSQGNGPLDERSEPMTLPGESQRGMRLQIAPTRPGDLLITASASNTAESDAVAQTTLVSAPIAAAGKAQAGWLDTEPTFLDLPQLPPGAVNAHLHLSIQRNDRAFVEHWTRNLRDYPHRCWEQMLSRALAAALAIERGQGEAWSDAGAVIAEALDNSAIFQGEDGDFRYFAYSPESMHYAEPAREIALTAFTVKALSLLKSLDHPVNEALIVKAREFLAGRAKEATFDASSINDSAFAFGALEKLSISEVAPLWEHWKLMSPIAQIAAARALATARHPQANDALQRILAFTVVRGKARILRLPQDGGRWMSSELREHCRLIELLNEHPELTRAPVLRELRLGLSDLYAGGLDSIDTQAGAHCLIASRPFQRADRAATAEIDVQFGEESTTLEIAAAESIARWQAPVNAQERLELKWRAPGTDSLSFVAELRYDEDARHAKAEAVGLAIDRRHQVLRDGAWTSMDEQAVREGDWIRVTLTVHVSAPRYFVALSDSVPGGLRPTDLTLSGVAGLDLQAVSDEGSYWFRTRRLDPLTPRFYAEYLPPGTHEVHYFARAGNAGDYLSPPAVAELMYGNASRARTAATRIRIHSLESATAR